MADTVINTNSNNYKAGVTATKVGTATAAQVLTGKTFTNSSGVGISGTMTNNGTWTNTPTVKGKVTIPAGYHNGNGYVDTSTVYTNAYNAGVTAADGRANTNSVNYKTGYNTGVTNADARVNTSSASYTNGYNAGKSSAFSSSTSYHYSTYATIWGEGTKTATTGTYTASAKKTVLVNFVCIYYKMAGDSTPTTSQKLYKGGSVIATNNYSQVIELNAGETLKGEVYLNFDHDGTKSVYALYTAALVVTELN